MIVVAVLYTLCVIGIACAGVYLSYLHVTVHDYVSSVLIAVICLGVVVQWICMLFIYLGFEYPPI